MNKRQGAISLKLCSLLFAALFPFFLSAQQDWRLSLNDKWYNNKGSKGLKVGDPMPDISMGKVLNNTTGKTRFTQFKGKLVILDFWTTNCNSCVAGFPHMAKLQREFGDKIQVILVNDEQTENTIRKEMGDGFMKKFLGLPSIVAEKSIDLSNLELDKLPKTHLYRLFPSRVIGEHIWIGPDGIIKLRGQQANTNPEKINDYLEGRQISMIPTSNTVPGISHSNAQQLLYKHLGSFKKTPVVYGSYFTPYNDEINGDKPFIKLNLVDSASSTVRNIFINADINRLYHSVIENEIQAAAQRQAIIYSNDENFIENADSIQISAYWTSPAYAAFKGDETDKTYRDNMYCYEQILPINTSIQEQCRKRFEDLNDFFRAHLGFTTTIETRKIPCYALVRTSAIDKISPKIPTGKRTEITVEGKKMYHWANPEIGTLGSVISYTIDASLVLKSLFEQNRSLGKPWMLLDETGWDRFTQKVDIILPKPEDVTSIDDIRQALKPYDLDIIEVQREFKFAVFSKVSKDAITNK